MLIDSNEVYRRLGDYLLATAPTGYEDADEILRLEHICGAINECEKIVEEVEADTMAENAKICPNKPLFNGKGREILLISGALLFGAILTIFSTTRRG